MSTPNRRRLTLLALLLTVGGSCSRHVGGGGSPREFAREVHACPDFDVPVVETSYMLRPGVPVKVGSYLTLRRPPQPLGPDWEVKVRRGTTFPGTASFFIESGSPAPTFDPAIEVEFDYTGCPKPPQKQGTKLLAYQVVSSTDFREQGGNDRMRGANPRVEFLLYHFSEYAMAYP